MLFRSKRQLQSPAPLRLKIIYNDLIFATRLIDRHSSTGDDMKPVFKREPEPRRGRPEENGANLARLVFERAVEMTGCRSTEVGDLAFQPYIRKAGFKRRPHETG